MKRIYFSILICIAAITTVFGQGAPGNLPASIKTASQSVAPTSTKNYVVSYTYLEPKTTHSTTYKAGETAPEIQYFDGLGRPMETVQVKASQLGSDMVTLQIFDYYGRPDKQYLPYPKGTSNNGAFVTEATFVAGQKTFLTGIYGTTDKDYGYAQTAYEVSPLKHPEKQGSPGAAWRTTQNALEFVYKTNSTSIASWLYNGSSYASFNYLAGSLYLKETTDEDNKVLKEYTDKQGRSVQKEINGLKTRYCYDKKGLLRCVLQPGATSPATTALCFYYNYDERNRLIEKQIPGKAKEYLVYDTRDRLVLSQDGELDTQDKWQYTIYDDLNRPVEQGLWASASSRSTLATTIAGNIDYMLSQGSRVAQKYLYYDNYSMPDEIAINSDAATLGQTQASNNTGRLTMEKTALLDYETGMDTEITTTYYYDKFGRLIQSAKDNHLAGKDYITNAYNFAGLVTQTRYRHTADGATSYTDQYNDYDHRGRVMKVRHLINGANEVLMAGNNYNEAGELVDKYLHSVSGGAFLQRMDYTYNIRGWLTLINSPTSFTENDKFGLELNYNVAPSGGSPLYNGNISGMKWGVYGNNYTDMLYRFSYDGSNRLTSADFYKSGYSTSAFDCTYAYDSNGNLSSLVRKNTSGSTIDNLSYNYNGNKINYVNDASGDYASTVDYPGDASSSTFSYDQNGNMTYEPSKGISLDYNLLNLPVEADFGSNRKINYFYTFDGEKVRQAVEDNGTVSKTDYCGPFVYETASGTRSLKYIVTPEGRAVKNGGSWDYEYNLKDHLGNTRVVIKNSSGVAQVVQERHYYPFGMEMSTLSSGASTNKYLYNSKELENAFDLGWYDYGARFYDPELGRWHTIDPHADKYYSLSPYNYVANNPIIAVDPDGRKIKIVGKNRDQTLLDIGRLYATSRGQAIIRTLAQSEKTYKIGGGTFRPRLSSWYSRLTNRLNYYQKDNYLDGVKNQSYITLAHELYHAYQDETDKDYDNDEMKEIDAMMFENYVRDVYGSGKHRKMRGGKQLLGRHSSFSNSFGQQINSKSVSVQTIVTEIGGNEGAESGENVNAQDNTKVTPVKSISVQHILEYMDKNKLEKLTIEF